MLVVASKALLCFVFVSLGVTVRWGARIVIGLGVHHRLPSLCMAWPKLASLLNAGLAVLAYRHGPPIRPKDSPWILTMCPRSMKRRCCVVNSRALAKDDA